MVNDVTLQNYEEGRDIYLSLTGELREKISNAKTDKELNFYKDKYSTLIQNVLYLRGKTVEKGKKGACGRYSEPKLKKRISCSNNQFLGTPKIIDKKIFSLIQELDKNLKDYRGNENQVKLAKKIGISHLGKLHSMLSVLGYIKDLKYNKIDLPVKQVELLIQKLEKGIKPYRGNENQIKLADDMGISNLGYLYSALSALGYVKKLEYNNINLPVAKVKLLIQKLEEKLEDYVGNENQIKLADDLGISHLGQLYNVLSALGYIEKLEYNYINLPVEQVKKLGGTFLQICNLRIKYIFYLTDIVKKSLSDIPLYTEFILFLVKSEGSKSNFSKDRLIRYMLKNVIKENMQYFKDILLNSTRYLWEINSLIDYEKKQELNDLEQILLATYKPSVKDYKRASDALGSITRTISSNGGLVARKNGESFEVGMKGDEENPQENFEKQELTELLERELPPKIYELLQEGSNMGEVISWIQENKPELVEDLREFL